MFDRIKTMIISRWRFFALFMLLFVLLPLPVVLAHGGGELQVGNAPIGSYLVSVWVNPPTAQAGQPIHVTVGIAKESTGEPVLDATVDVLIVTDQGVTVKTAVATTEQSINRLFYEADLADVPTGEYEMQLVVTGQAGRGDLAFPLVVVPRSIWPWVGGILVGVLMLGFVVRGWRRGAVGAVPRRGTAVSRRRSVD